MFKFRVGIIDDDVATTVSRISGALDGLMHVDVRKAHDVVTGLELLDNEFLHLLFLDLQLDEATDALEGGDIYEHVAQHKRATKIVLMTNHAQEEATVDLIYRLLSPLSSFDGPAVLFGLLDKGNTKESAEALRIVKTLSSAWLSSVVVVPSETASLVLERIDSKRSAPGWFLPRSVSAAAKVDEIDHVLSTLLGQTMADDAHLRSKTLALRPIDQGSSPAAVFLARTEGPEIEPVSWVVVKVAGAEQVVAEVHNYAYFARYDVGPDHRVELLSSSTGSSIGAIAYALAARRPEQVRSLRSLLRTNPEVGLYAVDRLFSPLAKHWLSFDGGNEAALAWFKEQYNFRYITRTEGLRIELTDVATAAAQSDDSPRNWQVKRDGLHFANGEGVIRFAARADQRLVNVDLRAAIIHGDMHTDNVLTAHPGDAPLADASLAVKLIDFASTGIGPRALDFAKLAVDQRLALLDPADSYQQIARTVHAERELWRRLWTEPAPDLIEEARSTLDLSTPWWIRLDQLIVANLRLNFDEGSPHPVTQSEYAVTCCLIGLRTSAVPWMESGADRKRARLRIASWMDPAISHLRDPTTIQTN